MKIKTLLPILGLTSVAAAAPVVASCACNPEDTVKVEFVGESQSFNVEAGGTIELKFHYTGVKSSILATADPIYDSPILIAEDPIMDESGNFTLHAGVVKTTAGTYNFGVKFTFTAGSTVKELSVGGFSYTIA